MPRVLFSGLLALALFSPSTASAHLGGLDSLGCHHNRKAGGYHCHRGKLAGQTFSSKAEALEALKKLEAKEQKAAPGQAVWRTVARVIDGDTIELDGGGRVRLIGVDTPETKHPNRPVERFGREAYEFTRKLCEGKKVRLESDQDTKDRYGRTLAYVFLEDGTFVNAEIIKQGYGFAYVRYPFKYIKEFRQYEREAREAGRGLWKED